MSKIINKYGHIVFLCLLTCLISLYSPLNPFFDKLVSIDQAVFFTIAEGLLDGELAYVDFFDHKGPLLYMILAVGLCFGKSLVGNFIIELLFIFTTVYFIYKIAFLFAPKWISAIVPAVIFCTEITLFTTSNSEEYILPFICIAVYLFLMQIRDGINKKQVFLIGFLGMLVFFIKYNYCMIWAGIGIVLFLRMFFRKNKCIDIVKMCLAFFSGMLAAAIPFAIYLFATDSFDEFMETYVIYSLFYADMGGIMYKIQCALSFLNTPLFVFLICAFALCIIHKLFYSLKKRDLVDSISNEKFNLFGYFLLIVIVILVVVGSPGKFWEYYKHATMIIYAAPIAIVATTLYSFLNKKMNYVLSSIVVVLFLILGIHNELTIENFQIKKDAEYESVMNICEIIDVQCEKDDTMISFACDCFMYFYSDGKPASRIIFPSATVISDKLLNELMRDLEMNKPKIITFTNEWTWAMNEGFITKVSRFTEENYLLYYEDEYRKVYLRNN